MGLLGPLLNILKAEIKVSAVATISFKSQLPTQIVGKIYFLRL